MDVVEVQLVVFGVNLTPVSSFVGGCYVSQSKVPLAVVSVDMFRLVDGNSRIRHEGVGANRHRVNCS